MKAAEADELNGVLRFIGYVALVVAAILVAFIYSQLGGFHTVVMLVLTSPLSITGLLLLRITN